MESNAFAFAVTASAEIQSMDPEAKSSWNISRR